MDVQVSMPPPPPPPPPPPAFFAETTTSQIASSTPPPPPQQPATTTNVAAPPTRDRIWLHPWTVDEMRENASQWSLAGDAGVLLYLEQFSDKLTQRGEAIQQHLNQTVNAVKSTHTRVLNCLNEFTSLANTQFIENRVYDEDETANTASKKDEQTTEKTNVNSTEAQEKVLQRYAEAIQYGLAILDTHFERVEPKLDNTQNGGGSFIDDDEDGGVPFEPILEPKDPYECRPLPHLIGTTDFMQDDYVGLGDLMTLRDEDGYELVQTKKVESEDSALSSSDEEEEDDEKETDFQAQMSTVPEQKPKIVPAGTSVLNPQPPPIELSDSEEEDDPFGINKNIKKIDDIPSKQTIPDDDLFDDELKPSKTTEKNRFTLDFDNEEENDLFDKSIQKPPPPPSQPVREDTNDNFGEKSSESSGESDESEEPKHKGIAMFGGAQAGMSELAQAVLRRRNELADPDDEIDDFVKKPVKTSNKTKKPKSEPSSNTISNLTSQPLTTPPKISKPSIFGEQDDDDDLFGETSQPSPVISSDSKPSLIIPPKKEKEKEKDMFDDVSDEDDPFSFNKKPLATSTKKNEPTPTPPLTVPFKRPIIQPDNESDDDEIFETKKTQPKQTTITSTSTVTEKKKPPNSDDELFTTSTITKPQPSPSTAAKKVSDDEDPLFVSKPSAPPVVPAAALAAVSSVKKPVTTAGDDSDDEMFGISKKPVQAPTTGPQKVVASTKDDDDDDGMFDTPKKPVQAPTAGPSKVVTPTKDDDDDLFNKPKETSKETLKVRPPTHSDEDEELFGPKTHEVKSPSSASSIKTTTHQDPLGIQKSDEPTSPIVQPIKTPSTPIKEKDSVDDSDEDSKPKRQLNASALGENEKPDVKKLSSRLNINPGAFKPPSFKSVRPKASSITEESPKPSVDDDEPIQNIESPPPPQSTIVKKTPALDLGSDDELFDNKKKVTPTIPIVGQKDKTNIENENETGRQKIKNLQTGLTIPMRTPGAQSKPKPNEANELNNTSQTTSNEEPTADKAMLNMLKDRTKAVRSRAPPSKKTRSTGAAAAASTTFNDIDDFFASPSSTTTATSSPPPRPAPTAAPVTRSPTVVPVTPPPAVVPVIPPPEIDVPVTGLTDKPAAIAIISDKQINSKEKKKFSLFDSDDSDTDELLFGFNNKKTKSPVVSKPTTTPSATSKATTKSSILDDDDDFLSKRPTKKNTKPVDDSDIFADVSAKTPQVNKAKKDWSIMNKSTTDETDDIFTDVSTKSSSTTAKSKPTNVKNKSTKNFNDIFDDPLNISSKK